MTVVGQQLQVQPPYFGTWVNNPTLYSFQWQYSLNGSTLAGDLSGETRSDHIAADSDIGTYVRCEVIASNASGDSSAVYTEWVLIGATPLPPGSTFPIHVPVLLSGPTPAPDHPRHFDSHADHAGHH